MLAIETTGLTRRFGSFVAVDRIDLSVPEAAVYGFLGPNGAGKTTTIRTLLGLIKPDAGAIRMFGGPVALERVGAMVELPSLYGHLTGRENLEVTRRLLGAPRNRIDECLRIVRLENASERLVRQYSLGMRQRLGIALALLNEPDLLIVDEPTNGLDPAGIHEMRALIRTFAADHGVTVFLSSHLLSEVEQVATHVGIINGGRLLFQGPIEELRRQQRARVIVGVSDREEALRILAAEGIAGRATDDGNLELPPIVDAANVNALLVQNGVRVHHLSSSEGSLEEIFLELTGTGAEA